MRLYLAHPFEMRKEIREWELEFEKKTGVELINPFYDVPERDDMILLDAGIITPRSMKKKKNGLEIVERDLKQIELSDGLLGFIEAEQQSFGTPMELFYNSRILQHPSYVITESQKGHPWIRGLSTKIFTNRNKCLKYFEKCHM